jgi:hypothetical protein
VTTGASDRSSPGCRAEDYWAERYWAEDYWAEDYWAEEPTLAFGVHWV